MNESIKYVKFPFSDSIYNAVVNNSKVNHTIKEQNKNDFTVEYLSKDDIISELSRLENNYDIPTGVLTNNVKVIDSFGSSSNNGGN